MPLDTSGLGTDVAAWMSAPDATAADNATTLSDAVAAYAVSVVPASTTVAAAGATLQSALVSAMALTDATSTATALEAAFLAFATTVGAGMASGGFTAVPPPSPLGFAALLAARPASSAAAATSWSSAIDTWMRTGTAAPNPPGTVFSIWS